MASTNNFLIVQNHHKISILHSPHINISGSQFEYHTNNTKMWNSPSRRSSQIQQTCTNIRWLWTYTPTGGWRNLCHLPPADCLSQTHIGVSAWSTSSHVKAKKKFNHTSLGLCIQIITQQKYCWRGKDIQWKPCDCKITNGSRLTMHH